MGSGEELHKSELDMLGEMDLDNIKSPMLPEQMNQNINYLRGAMNRRVELYDRRR